jgi:hypothetical protein
MFPGIMLPKNSKRIIVGLQHGLGWLFTDGSRNVRPASLAATAAGRAGGKASTSVGSTQSFDGAAPAGSGRRRAFASRSRARPSASSARAARTSGLAGNPLSGPRFVCVPRVSLSTPLAGHAFFSRPTIPSSLACADVIRSANTHPCVVRKGPHRRRPPLAGHCGGWQAGRGRRSVAATTELLPALAHRVELGLDRPRARRRRRPARPMDDAARPLHTAPAL